MTTQERPAWIEEFAAKIVDEMIEHAAARVWDKDKKSLAAGTTEHFGQAVPALTMAIKEAIKEKLDDLGAGAVQDYVATRKKEGSTASAALGDELGPLMARGRVGVLQAFGQRAPESKAS